MFLSQSCEVRIQSNWTQRLGVAEQSSKISKLRMCSRHSGESKVVFDGQTKGLSKSACKEAQDDGALCSADERHSSERLYKGMESTDQLRTGRGFLRLVRIWERCLGKVPMHALRRSTSCVRSPKSVSRPANTQIPLPEARLIPSPSGLRSAGSFSAGRKPANSISNNL